MARPRVFVSSTFYDLKHIRASLEVFIESLGFDAVLFEKGDIAFDPDVPLDESCYREASTSDIFVLIIGGRYGSSASSNSHKKGGKFHEIYESITKKEFEAAQESDIPTFILVDSAVAAEYQTYLRNRETEKINYAHVDSVGVFRLLESIFERGRNNPVFHFDRATQIEAWLREQWAGLFRELLRVRSQQKQLTALNSQVTELKSVNETLKTYLEAVLNKINPDQSGDIIRDEEVRLRESRKQIALEDNAFYRHLINVHDMSPDDAKVVIMRPEDADEAVAMMDEIATEKVSTRSADVLRRIGAAQRDYNRARAILDRDPVDFTSSSFEDAARAAKSFAERQTKKAAPEAGEVKSVDEKKGSPKNNIRKRSAARSRNE